MRKFIIISCALLGLISNNCFNQESATHYYTTSEYIQGAKYVIDVVLPSNYDSTRRYPIVYCVDYWLGSKVVPGVIFMLNLSQLIEPFIIVGIGNDGDITKWSMERIRDFTPFHIPKDDLSLDHTLGTSGVTGGAKNFLSFLKYELIPSVESRFLSDTTKRGFFGYSLGGLMGAYILSNDSKLFQKYFLGSPSLGHNNFALIDSLNSISPEKLSAVKDIFMTVGEEESGNQLKGFVDFRDCIIKKDISSLKLESLIIKDEGHMSAILYSYFKAFKYLYSKN